MENVKPKPGRPAPLGGRRKARSFKANDLEWEHIKALAKQEGLNVSDYIRSKILSKID
jgi:ActR/RegA family two-component response regulator